MNYAIELKTSWEKEKLPSMSFFALLHQTTLKTHRKCRDNRYNELCNRRVNTVGRRDVVHHVISTLKQKTMLKTQRNVGNISINGFKIQWEQEMLPSMSFQRFCSRKHNGNKENLSIRSAAEVSEGRLRGVWILESCFSKIITINVKKHDGPFMDLSFHCHPKINGISIQISFQLYW